MMILTLEEDEIKLLIRKSFENKDFPIPEGYLIEDISVSYDEDVSRLGVDIHLVLKSSSNEIGLIAE